MGTHTNTHKHTQRHKKTQTNTNTHKTTHKHTHNVTQRTDTHIFTGGGTHPQCNPTNRHTYLFDKQTNQLNGQTEGDAPTMHPNERTHLFSQGGGRTHDVTQQTDIQIKCLNVARHNF